LVDPAKFNLNCLTIPEFTKDVSNGKSNGYVSTDSLDDNGNYITSTTEINSAGLLDHSNKGKLSFLIFE